MTAIQIYALIAIALSTSAVYWIAYRNGFSNGRAEGYSEGYDVGGCAGFRDGMDEGKAIQRSDNWEEIRNLEHTLNQARDQHKKLYAHYERALAASKLGEPARQTLLDIAEKLRIAAATFNALRTGKAITRETTALRDQALAMADLLKPVEIKVDAKVEIAPGSISLRTDDAKKAALYFQQEHQAIATTTQKTVGGAA
ncbi:hypothetical protein ACFFQ5_20525 [Pseudomonas brassicacearum]|uniref:hypothetical protein n=1 Tax=Pseudomonas brassicacearum TaxID=930166 RepID=UPI00087B5A46|nr:hypothetical protein [Pseudomonas brassicacearum]SDP08831.1 hypothetical protein SAMN04490180_0294 [Pseudomonas brassicacearum]